MTSASSLAIQETLPPYDSSTPDNDLNRASISLQVLEFATMDDIYVIVHDEGVMFDNSEPLDTEWEDASIWDLLTFEGS